MPRAKRTSLEIGDVIKTHPKDGFWGCAVVLNTREKCEQFNRFCLIGITPIVFRHDFTWREVADFEFSILEFVRGIRLFPGDTRSRRETCIGCYDARPNPELPTIGRVDASKVFAGPIGFEVGDATNGKWPLCGRIKEHLGNEAVVAWRRTHDAVQLALDVEASRRSHDALMARLKLEERAKRDARKQKRRP
jgi:hypothetical protein